MSITDGAILADYLLVVSAVAEHSADSSVDGPCLGAAIAVLDRGGRVLQLHEVQPIFKIEGVHAWLENAQIQLLMVTDADDENTPSYLLEAEMSAFARESKKNGVTNNS